MNSIRQSPYLKPVVRLFIYLLSFMIIMRLIFIGAFLSQAQDFAITDLLKSLYLGTRFDLRVAITLALPLILLAPFIKPYNKSGGRKLWALLYTLVLSFLSLIYFLDFGYYSYLEGRVNATVVNFAANPLISAQMLWESYPIIWITLAFIALACLHFKILSKAVFQQQKHLYNRSVLQKASVFSLVFALTLVGWHGKLSQYPLRWSEAFFTHNKFITALALNPFHYLIDTYRNRTKDYELEKVKESYEVLAKYLKVEDIDKETLNFKRPIETTPMFDEKPNVVVIVMESFAAYKSGRFGNPLDSSPYFDELSKKGYLFKNYYVQTEGTARSMFCLLTGIADINSNRTSSRNPLIVNQHTVANAFRGYDKNYFIGGSANWGNIRGVYNNNILDLNIYEEGVYQLENTDVWGLSDLDLFKEAYRILNEKDADKPFFAIIQAASFHRPFTIPENKDDFEILDPAKADLEKAGFYSKEEFNSFRFSDYSLGKFFKLYHDQPFARNTVFVVVGDHGLPDYNAAHLDKGVIKYGLERFHTPLWVYSPSFTENRTLDTVATEPDVLPTMAGITDNPYTNTTLGRNLFAIAENEERYAFNYVYYASPLQLHLMDNELLMIGTPKKMGDLYNYRSDSPEKVLNDEMPEKHARMKELLRAFYEISRYMLYNNPNLEFKKAK